MNVQEYVKRKYDSFKEEDFEIIKHTIWKIVNKYNPEDFDIAIMGIETMVQLTLTQLIADYHWNADCLNETD